MTTSETKASAEFLEYFMTLGMTVMEGRGFYYPVDTAIGQDSRLYVVNRSLDNVARGVRVTMCDIDSEYYGNFGSFGLGCVGSGVSCGTPADNNHIKEVHESLNLKCLTVLSGKVEFLKTIFEKTFSIVNHKLITGFFKHFNCFQQMMNCFFSPLE